MTKITLESRGISVSIHNSNQGEDNIESIGFAFLGKIAEEALNKINSKRKLNKLVSDDFDSSEKEDDGYEEEDEYEEDEEDEDDEDDEDDEYEEEEEEEEEDEEEDYDEEEDLENTKTSKLDSKNSNKKFTSKPSQCLKYIKNNNKDELIKLVNNSSGKIRIRGTTKDQRNWVYQIFSEIDNVSTWSWYGKNGRVLVIDIYSQKN